MRLFHHAIIALFALLLVLSCSMRVSSAANYTPSLLNPTDSSTGIQADGFEFSWSVSSQPDKFVIEWATDISFSATTLLFAYESTATTYVVNGLPGNTEIYWRVSSYKNAIKYTSVAYSFTTGSDNEPSRVVRIFYDDFSTFNSNVWTISGATYYTYYDTVNSCILAQNSYYWGDTAYLDGQFSIPSTPTTLKYKWSHGLGWGVGDEMYVEYSTDGSNFIEITSLTGNNYESGQTGWNTPGPWSTSEVDFPADALGKSIWLRFRFYTQACYDSYLDDIEISYLKYERAFDVTSDYGTPSPSGSTIIDAGTRITASVDATAFAPGITDKRYLCSGWTGSGSVPLTGTTNSFSVTVYRRSTLTWKWSVEYRVIVSSTNGYGSPTPGGTNYYLSGTLVTFTSAAVQDTGSPTERYGMKNWTGTGSCTGQGSQTSIAFSITSASTLTWVYKKQYKITFVSAYGSSGFDPALGDNWIFDTTVVLATAPDFVDIGGGNGVMWNGYSSTGTVTPNQPRPVVISVREPLVFTWLWSPAYNLNIVSLHGVLSGTLPGWYLSGTAVNVSISEYALIDDESRWHCVGWTGTGSASSGTSATVPQFLLNSSTTITWNWNREFLVEMTENAGTTSPTSGWFAEGSLIAINAVPPVDTSDTRYFFSMWAGSGTGSYSGTAPAANATVSGPLTERAIWNIEYRLVVIPINGSLASDPSGWYSSGSPVLISAVPPEASSGERYVPSWDGTGAGSVTLPRLATTPATVSVTVNAPIVQRVQWNIQYLLTIGNPEGFGFCQPNPGAYWFFDDEFAQGYCKYADASMVCTGFDATRDSGGPISGDTAFFSIPMTSPTSLIWKWGTRPAEISVTWSGAASLSEVATGPTSIVSLPDGRILVYFATPESGTISRAVLHDGSWSTTVLVENIGNVSFLEASADSWDIYLVFYRADPSGLIFYHDGYFSDKVDFQPASSITTSGSRCSIAVHDGDVYISYFDMADASLKVAHLIQGGWETTTVDNSDGAGYFNSIAIPVYSGLPVVAFARSGGTKGLFFATYDGVNWNTETLVQDFAGWFCSMALEMSGMPVIAYQTMDAPNGSALHLITPDGSGWTDTLIDNNGDTGYNSALVIDASGYVHILYTNRHDLIYSRDTAGGWTRTVLVTGGVDGPVSVGLNSGRPAVVFTRDGKLNYVDGTGTTSSGGGTTPTPTTSGGGGGCFIATAAFGALSAGTVSRLTDVRDAVLSGSSAGTVAVSLYYTLSPNVARAIAGSEAARALLRGMLK
ncbi:MAG: CFI-box-CTERM domain-containing protein [Candidatus Brocadiia bacterium]